MSQIETGDTAPELTLATDSGDQVTLTDYRGKKAVVLFFYPKDGTPACTKEACAFRDAYEDFVEAGAVVIGVIGDSAARHQSFAANHQLPFVLVSDKNGKARRAFGVPKSMGLFPGRVTYVIDREGIVRHVFSSQFAAEQHVKESLAAIGKMNR